MMRAASGRAGWIVAAAALALGCATPSRRLTTRAVDDPAVLPRGLASVAANQSVERLDPGDRWSRNLMLTVRYGITDKLELDNLSLRYAVLDDAPPPEGTPPATPRRRLRLVLHGGVTGIGYSSLDGLIAFPTLSAQVGKHLGTRVYVWAELWWLGVWVGTPQPRATAYSSYLWPNTGRASEGSLSGGAVVQLVDHLTLGGSVTADELGACTLPDCTWAARGYAASLGPSLRPWRWLSLSVYASVGERWRNLELPVPQRDPQVPDVPPRHVSWAGLSGQATLYW
jgi:hypothetical protein